MSEWVRERETKRKRKSIALMKYVVIIFSEWVTRAKMFFMWKIVFIIIYWLSAHPPLLLYSIMSIDRKRKTERQKTFCHVEKYPREQMKLYITQYEMDWIAMWPKKISLGYEMWREIMLILYFSGIWNNKNSHFNRNRNRFSVEQ